MRMNLGHAQLWHWGLKHITIQPDATILDVGCGGGKAVQMLAQAAPSGKACGIDHSEEMVRLAQIVNQALVKEGRVEIECAAVSSLPFPDGTFDLATAFESYYFWPNLMDDLREIRRVLKPSATLLIANEVYKHEGLDEHNTDWVRLAGILHLQHPDECRATLAEAGYTIIEIDVVSKRNWIAAVARKPSAAADHYL
jgi:ubiquinone/menaquinone biosynthesis C-methylase UbiE